MESYNQDSDIVELLDKQDERAIALLFDRFFDYLCSIVYRVIHDYEASRDVVQDLFFDLWKKRESIKIKTALRPYLRRAAVNRGLNYLKKQKMVFSQDENAAIDLPADEVSGQLHLEHEELEQRIFSAIDGLPPKCKIIFSMSRFESMSYQEIATNLGISIKTVENQISKALKILHHEVHHHAS
ncbi:MAG: RNA polymerase sigma-70 factor (ECF subfamily) [Saprospiraceae bacterium]|jgi:RNA polymerase sigma-70 factor (ECF subfamily)